MAQKIYKFTMKVTDLTIKAVSDGKLMTYPDDYIPRLDILDPYGNSGYQIEVSAPSVLEARSKVIKTLKDMGFRVLK